MYDASSWRTSQINQGITNTQSLCTIKKLNLIGNEAICLICFPFSKTEVRTCTEDFREVVCLNLCLIRSTAKPQPPWYSLFSRYSGGTFSVKCFQQLHNSRCVPGYKAFSVLQTRSDRRVVTVTESKSAILALSMTASGRYLSFPRLWD